MKKFLLLTALLLATNVNANNFLGNKHTILANLLTDQAIANRVCIDIYNVDTSEGLQRYVKCLYDILATDYPELTKVKTRK